MSFLWHSAMSFLPSQHAAGFLAFIHDYWCLNDLMRPVLAKVLHVGIMIEFRVKLQHLPQPFQLFPLGIDFGFGSLSAPKSISIFHLEFLGCTPRGSFLFGVLC